MGLHGRGPVPDGVGWMLTIYPDAREAAGVFRASVDLREGVRSAPGEGRDPERSKAVAAGRARTAVRRYCAANCLNRLGTLTYGGEGCHDPFEVRQHVASFFRDLRAELGGRALPYLWVSEWHKSGHGLHVHFAIGRYAKRSVIEGAWGRGFVHIKLLGNLPVGSTALDEARHAAGYLSKYVGKGFEVERVPGLHRYEVAEGFQPRRERVSALRLEDVVTLASERMGGRPALVTTSDEWTDWSGPSAVALSWSS